MNFEEQLYEHLEKLNISYQKFEHPPVYTVEEAQVYWKDVPGARCKNLFLRDAKGKQHYLVVLEETKQLDMRAFGENHQLGKLSFASPDRLKKYLNLEPGSVTPFGLLWPEAGSVAVYIDQDLKNSELIGFHPTVNTATIVVKTPDFLRFLEERGNSVQFVSI